MSAFWSGHVGAAAGCCLLLSERCVCVCFGAGLLAPLQDAAAGCCCQSGVCALKRACWCSCSVPLQGAASWVRLDWSSPMLQGRCRVPLQVLLAGAAVTVVCALERACWCHCSWACGVRFRAALWSGHAGRRVPLQGAAWGCVCVCVCLWFPQVGVFDLVLFFKDLIPPGTTRGL